MLIVTFLMLLILILSFLDIYNHQKNCHYLNQSYFQTFLRKFPRYFQTFRRKFPRYFQTFRKKFPRYFQTFRKKFPRYFQTFRRKFPRYFQTLRRNFQNLECILLPIKLIKKNLQFPFELQPRLVH
jgi:hypothetical protein